LRGSEFNSIISFRKVTEPISEFLKFPPINVEAISKNLGYEIIRVNNFPDNHYGLTDFQEKKIFVRSRDHINRVRSTIAHEVAHILLKEYKTNPKNNFSGEIFEKIVEELGFQILMPPEIFWREVITYNLDMWCVAPLFKVSFEAASIRLSRVATFPIQIAFFYKYTCKWVVQTRSFLGHKAKYNKGDRIRAEQLNELKKTPNLSGVRESIMSYEKPLHTAILHENGNNLCIIAFVSKRYPEVIKHWQKKWTMN
jgi:Zn-dependent peptidase ImmA (M78 family)